MDVKSFIEFWLECIKAFQDFKKGEKYWLEALSFNNQYNVRSDNLKGKTYIISDEQFALISNKRIGYDGYK